MSFDSFTQWQLNPGLFFFFSFFCCVYSLDKIFFLFHLLIIKQILIVPSFSFDEDQTHMSKATLGSELTIHGRLILHLSY